MAKLCVVSLSDAERLFLQRAQVTGTAPARTITCACVLPKADRVLRDRNGPTPGPLTPSTARIGGIRADRDGDLQAPL